MKSLFPITLESLWETAYLPTLCQVWKTAVENFWRSMHQKDNEDKDSEDKDGKHKGKDKVKDDDKDDAYDNPNQHTM